MNKKLLHKEIQLFIHEYSEDSSKLAFAGSPFEGVSVQELIQQIESRRKIEKKLPTWYSKKAILYPPKLNLEQTSSEQTAKYKASLVYGETLADITGGFGVDSYYFSDKFQKVTHFEQNSSLSEITAHNFKELGKKNIVCLQGDGLDASLSGNYDVIYVDPSRRHDSKGKVFFLQDCEPNIIDNLRELLKCCFILMIKTSPMLDISLGMKDLAYVSKLHIVAVDNEVKELLWILQKDHLSVPTVSAVNITHEKSEAFSYTLGQSSKASYGPPGKYLYEPNVAIMKSGAFDLLSDKYRINKLHKHSHLFSNDKLIDFPGRRFKIEKLIPYHKADIRKELQLTKANITVRNFPENVERLRKKWKIKDGGDKYLFFTTIENDQKVIICCSKV